MGDGFKYPDKNDALTADYISTHEPYAGYWHQSEVEVLAAFRQLVKQEYGDHLDQVRLIDFGCGQGRLLVHFRDIFGQAVAIEPDASRLEDARSVIKSEGLSEKVSFHNLFGQQYQPTERMQVAICSHIIQHIPTVAVYELIQAIEKNLDPGGLLLLTLAHSQGKDQSFVCAAREGQGVIEREVSPSEFEDIASGDQNGILPIHFMGISFVRDLLAKNNFRVLDCRVFHILEDLGVVDQYAFRDDVVNQNAALQNHLGRDLSIIAQKIG